MDEQKIQTTLRFSPDFHEKLRIAVAKRRLKSIQLAVEQALELWLQQQSLPPSPPAAALSAAAAPAPATEWHQKLSEILASGDEAAIAAVKAQLDLIHARLRPSGRKRKAGSDPCAAAPFRKKTQGWMRRARRAAGEACRVVVAPLGVPLCLHLFAAGCWECPCGREAPCAGALAWLKSAG